MYSISNVKCRVTTTPFEIPPDIEKKSRKCKNFYSTTIDSYSFIIFPKNGCINISGVKSFAGINRIPPLIFHHFHLNICPDNITVDNSTASGNLLPVQPLHLHKLKVTEGWFIHIRPHVFPAAVIRKKVQKKGSIILFTNGKFIIVGGKSLTDIENAYKTLCQITNYVRP